MNETIRDACNIRVKRKTIEAKRKEDKRKYQKEMLENISTYDFGLEGRLDFPRLDLEPIDPPEERVSADVFFAFGSATQPLDWLLGQELHERIGIKRIRIKTKKNIFQFTFPISSLGINCQIKKVN